MLNRTYTKREEARDIINILRPDSLLVRTQKERRKKATEASVVWASNNPKEASDRGIKGGNGCLNKGVGIHAETFEVRSKRAKINYKEGKGFAKLTQEEKSVIGVTYGKPNLVGDSMLNTSAPIT
jgi:hypothetical protein